MTFNLLTFYTQYQGFCLVIFSLNHWELFCLDLEPNVCFKKYINVYQIEITLFNYTKKIKIPTK